MCPNDNTTRLKETIMPTTQRRGFPSTRIMTGPSREDQVGPPQFLSFFSNVFSRP